MPPSLTLWTSCSPIKEIYFHPYLYTSALKFVGRRCDARGRITSTEINGEFQWGDYRTRLLWSTTMRKRLSFGFAPGTSPIDANAPNKTEIIPRRTPVLLLNEVSWVSRRELLLVFLMEISKGTSDKVLFQSLKLASNIIPSYYPLCFDCFFSFYVQNPNWI